MMIRVVDYAGEIYWVNAEVIDSIYFDYRRDNTILHYHSGGSCMEIWMRGNPDDAKMMIDEALGQRLSPGVNTINDPQHYPGKVYPVAP